MNIHLFLEILAAGCLSYALLAAMGSATNYTSPWPSRIFLVLGTILVALAVL